MVKAVEDEKVPLEHPSSETSAHHELGCMLRQLCVCCIVWHSGALPLQFADAKSMLRLGVDVGGTNTDAVLLQGDTVIGSAKLCTTADRLSGIQNAVRSAIAGCSVGEVNQ